VDGEQAYVVAGVWDEFGEQRYRGMTGCSVVRASRDDQTARGRAGYWRHG
jgi:hypothetical protein